MATTLIKFRQGAGIPVVDNATVISTGEHSTGEPLWSTDLKRLYVTDGENNPVFIGPITVETFNNTGVTIATITVGENTYTIKAPVSQSGDTAVTQTLDVVNSNETNPTLITLTDTNSIELESSPANTNVTTVIAGAPAGTSESGKAKLLFDVQINVIDGGEW